MNVFIPKQNIIKELQSRTRSHLITMYKEIVNLISRSPNTATAKLLYTELQLKRLNTKHLWMFSKKKIIKNIVDLEEHLNTYCYGQYMMQIDFFSEEYRYFYQLNHDLAEILNPREFGRQENFNCEKEPKTQIIMNELTHRSLSQLIASYNGICDLLEWKRETPQEDEFYQKFNWKIYHIERKMRKSQRSMIRHLLALAKLSEAYAKKYRDIPYFQDFDRFLKVILNLPPYNIQEYHDKGVTNPFMFPPRLDPSVHCHDESIFES